MSKRKPEHYAVCDRLHDLKREAEACHRDANLTITRLLGYIEELKAQQHLEGVRTCVWRLVPRYNLHTATCNGTQTSLGEGGFELREYCAYCGGKIIEIPEES